MIYCRFFFCGIDAVSDEYQAESYSEPSFTYPESAYDFRGEIEEIEHTDETTTFAVDNVFKITVCAGSRLAEARAFYARLCSAAKTAICSFSAASFVSWCAVIVCLNKSLVVPAAILAAITITFLALAIFSAKRMSEASAEVDCWTRRELSQTVLVESCREINNWLQLKTTMQEEIAQKISEMGVELLKKIETWSCTGHSTDRMVPVEIMLIAAMINVIWRRYDLESSSRYHRAIPENEIKKPIEAFLETCPVLIPLKTAHFNHLWL